jgi:uncharacterized protein (DUF924 family)
LTILLVKCFTISMSTTTTVPRDVLQFWLPASLPAPDAMGALFKRWFDGGPELDDEIRARFGVAVEEARAGALDAWAQSREGRIALVILLDQFSRNLYRGSAAAFATDAKARALALESLENGHYAESAPFERMFLTLPLGHSEDLDDQRKGVALVEEMALSSTPELRPVFFFAADMARKHVATIARFGRMPLRNAALGRASTADEERFLAFEKAKPSPLGALARR